MNNFSDKDWKLFRSKIADWQETYIDKLNKEYIEILRGAEDAASKFWTLEKRIRNNLLFIMMSLLKEGAITLQDIDDFSDVKDAVKYFAGSSFKI